MAYVMIWNLYERVLWIAAFTIFIVGGLEYARKGREKEGFNERILMYGFAGLLFGLASAVLFLYMAELSVPGTYRNYSFHGDYGAVNITYEILFRLAWVSFYAGYTLFFLAFEISVKRTKYIPTIIGIMGIALCIVTPFNLLLTIGVVIFTLCCFSLFTILAMCIKWSELEFKVIASYIILGTLFLGHGVPAAMEWVKKLDLIPLWIPPLMVCVGGIFYLLPMLTKPGEFSRARSNSWMLFSFFTLALQIFLLVFYIIAGFPSEWYYVTGTVLFFLIYVQFVYFKTMKPYFSEDESLKSREPPLNILALFSKPQRITEEEVSISKEKKICLVCKGKVERSNIYLCPDCATFYCKKCSDALSDLENMCWVCDTPFDVSKPVKKMEKEEEEIKFEKK